MRKWNLLPGLMVLIALTGCLTTQKSTAIRQELSDSGVRELDTAYVEVITAAQDSIKAQAGAAFNALDAQYQAGLEKAQGAGKLDAAAATQLSANYINQRKRLEDQIVTAAGAWARIAAKIRLGRETLQAVTRMDTQREVAERQLLIDIRNDALPLILQAADQYLNTRAALAQAQAAPVETPAPDPR